MSIYGSQEDVCSAVVVLFVTREDCVVMKMCALTLDFVWCFVLHALVTAT